MKGKERKMESNKKIISESGVWNVRKCGAVGDGKTSNTEIIQEAINTCHLKGGGRVLIPPGVYLSGSLMLKSDVDLHLTRGATLLGSPNIQDYHPNLISEYVERIPAGFPKNIVAAHLLSAKNSERISITGQGTIDGNSSVFFGERRTDTRLKRFSIIDSRPWHTIAFYDCKDILVEGVHILNATTYSISPYNCKRVRIEGLTIRNHPSTPNGDGIDIDCCKDVIIYGCCIDTADDCIAIKSGSISNPPNFSRNGMPCENIIASNCNLKSMTTGVRLGVEGDNPIINVNLNNLSIESYRGIGLDSCVIKRVDIVEGTLIENVNISQVTINNSTTPVYAVCGSNTSPKASIGRVSIHQLQATGNGASIFYGKATKPIDYLSIRDVHLRIKGHFDRTPYPEGDIPDNLDYAKGGAKERVPYALYGRYLKNLRLDGITVDMKDATGPWAGNCRFDDTEKI